MAIVPCFNQNMLQTVNELLRLATNVGETELKNTTAASRHLYNHKVTTLAHRIALNVCLSHCGCFARTALDSNWLM